MDKVRLPGWNGPVLNAARWLRGHLDIPEYEVIEDRFCKYFNCEIEQVMMDSPNQTFPLYTYAVFKEQDAVMFVLRWS